MLRPCELQFLAEHNRPVLQLGWHKNASYHTELRYSAEFTCLKTYKWWFFPSWFLKAQAFQMFLDNSGWLQGLGLCINIPEVGCKPNIWLGRLIWRALWLGLVSRWKIFVNLDFNRHVFFHLFIRWFEMCFNRKVCKMSPIFFQQAYFTMKQQLQIIARHSKNKLLLVFSQIQELKTAILSFLPYTSYSRWQFYSVFW